MDLEISWQELGFIKEKKNHIIVSRLFLLLIFALGYLSTRNDNTLWDTAITNILLLGGLIFMDVIMEY